MSQLNTANTPLQDAAEAVAKEWDQDPAKKALFTKLLRDKKGQYLEDVVPVVTSLYQDETPPSALAITAAMIQQSEDFAETVLRFEETQQRPAITHAAATVSSKSASDTLSR